MFQESYSNEWFGRRLISKRGARRGPLSQNPVEKRQGAERYGYDYHRSYCQPHCDRSEQREILVLMISEAFVHMISSMATALVATSSHDVAEHAMTKANKP